MDDHESVESEDEEGWEDVHPDNEEQQVLCLFEDVSFPDVRSLLDHTCTVHNFDLKKVFEDLELDIYGKIKMINYLRLQKQAGRASSEPPQRSDIEDEKYLRPVLEDDALLYGLDEINGDSSHTGENGQAEGGNQTKILKAEIAALKDELATVKSRFEEYKQTAERVMDDRYAILSTPSGAESINDTSTDTDTGYFDSYGNNEIHESMLKDTVRTHAYRDFIYENKHLFHGKVVLDVGCGTGILSMFCARAGAKHVIAVDNSDILIRARQNVFDNGLEGLITCVKGKIEEAILPINKVDIIVSEWMGYCLLYEAMLNSILWARDQYLAVDGLLVPSHVSMHLAACADPDFTASHVSFWDSVYGFSMTSMAEKVYDDVIIRHHPPSAIVSNSASILQISLYTAQRKDLDFLCPIRLIVNQDIDAFDGWVVWFDVIFGPSRDFDVSGKLPDGKELSSTESGRAIHFTTGPYGPETHWKQGLFLIKYGKENPSAVKKGQVIEGAIKCVKPPKRPRDLDVEISWSILDEHQQENLPAERKGEGNGSDDQAQKKYATTAGAELKPDEGPESINLRSLSVVDNDKDEKGHRGNAEVTGRDQAGKGEKSSVMKQLWYVS